MKMDGLTESPALDAHWPGTQGETLNSKSQNPKPKKP